MGSHETSYTVSDFWALSFPIQERSSKASGNFETQTFLGKLPLKESGNC